MLQYLQELSILLSASLPLLCLQQVSLKNVTAIARMKQNAINYELIPTSFCNNFTTVKLNNCFLLNHVGTIQTWYTPSLVREGRGGYQALPDIPSAATKAVDQAFWRLNPPQKPSIFNASPIIKRFG